MLRWSNHLLFITIDVGIIVALIVAAAGFVDHLLYPAGPTVGANHPPSPKTQIEITANSFEIPAVASNSSKTELPTPEVRPVPEQTPAAVAPEAEISGACSGLSVGTYSIPFSSQTMQTARV